MSSSTPTDRSWPTSIPTSCDALDDDEEYGLALGACLFGGGVGTAFQTAVATSQSHGVRLRVRLVMDCSATALHGLRWETIRDPQDGSTLRRTRTCCSRATWQPRLASVTSGPARA